MGFALNRALSMWHKFETKPFGKAMFSHAICFKAPYFGSISPRFEELKPGFARVSMRKQRKVTNHIGFFRGRTLIALVVDRQIS